jgi:N-acetyl-anhydromuramyl-L-alanine amidase AmpD
VQGENAAKLWAETMTRDHESRSGRRLPSVARAVAPLIALAAGVAVGAGGGGTGLAAAVQPARAATGAVAPGSRLALMSAAAQEFGVPVRLLLAISYNQTRWASPGDSPSIDGGYGLMNLTTKTLPAAGGRGLTTGPVPPATTLARTHDALDEAARLLHVPAATLKTSERQNVRGAAAVLARYARALSGGTLPTSLGGWYGAVAEYSGATSVQSARSFADDVFRTLASGASLTTVDRQVMDLPATPGLRPDRAQLGRLGLKPAAPAATSPAVDCPSALNCTFVPAAYAQDSAADPSNYGNYDTAGRPASMADPSGQPASMGIRYIIIHDTEGSYDAAISTFQNPASYVSANYVIRSSDGAVTEMVPPADVSWGAGDWYVNMHAINIENEGFAAQGKTWYTQAMYQSDAALVRYLAAQYGIPLDRAHILGHEDVPGPTNAWTAAQHWDPGPFWNWDHFMALVHGVSDSAEQASGGSATRGTHQLVTIDPTFATNKPVVTDCPGTGCVTLPGQPANFVYLRTGPGTRYPLIADPVLGGSKGSTADSYWGDKATTGETFVYAGQSGKWTAIWFAGRKAWFYNPPGTQQTARYTGGQVIGPRAGLTSIPVYGAAYPEASAYPPAVPVLSVVKLKYTIKAGQAYPAITGLATDYYYAATINSSLPDDHTLITGTTAYVQISYNHRRFFVQAQDVTVESLP